MSYTSSAMNIYLPFSAMDFTYLLETWKEHEFNSVRIVMGPLDILLELDIYRSTIHMVPHEISQVTAGTLKWYDSRFMLFRCLYGLIRLHGLSNWEWEIPNEFAYSDLTLYQEQFRLHQPYLRVKYPIGIGDAFIIENLWSYAYMQIYPVLQPHKPTTTYPFGETTMWFDTILQMNPRVGPDFPNA